MGFFRATSLALLALSVFQAEAQSFSGRFGFTIRSHRNENDYPKYIHQITHVIPGSPAYQLQLRIGDKLMVLEEDIARPNNSKTNILTDMTPEQVNSAFANLRPDTRYILVVMNATNTEVVSTEFSKLPFQGAYAAPKPGAYAAPKPGAYAAPEPAGLSGGSYSQEESPRDEGPPIFYGPFQPNARVSTGAYAAIQPDGLSGGPWLLIHNHRSYTTPVTLCFNHNKRNINIKLFGLSGFLTRQGTGLVHLSVSSSTNVRRFQKITCHHFSTTPLIQLLDLFKCPSGNYINLGAFNGLPTPCMPGPVNNFWAKWTIPPLFWCNAVAVNQPLLIGGTHFTLYTV